MMYCQLYFSAAALGLAWLKLHLLIGSMYVQDLSKP